MSRKDKAPKDVNTVSKDKNVSAVSKDKTIDSIQHSYIKCPAPLPLSTFKNQNIDVLFSRMSPSTNRKIRQMGKLALERVVS